MPVEIVGSLSLNGRSLMTISATMDSEEVYTFADAQGFVAIGPNALRLPRGETLQPSVEEWPPLAPARRCIPRGRDEITTWALYDPDVPENNAPLMDVLSLQSAPRGTASFDLQLSVAGSGPWRTASAKIVMAGYTRNPERFRSVSKSWGRISTTGANTIRVNDSPIIVVGGVTGTNGSGIDGYSGSATVDLTKPADTTELSQGFDQLSAESMYILSFPAP